jgi:hypothetical protein
MGLRKTNLVLNAGSQNHKIRGENEAKRLTLVVIF